MRTPPEQREALLDEFERSGMSGAAFAQHCGIKYPTFMAWRQARARRQVPTEEAAPKLGLAELVIGLGAGVPGPQGAEGMPVELPGGVRLYLRGPQDAPLAAALLAALQRAGAARC